MVAPHPDLMKRIRNTRKLVKQKREHLIPDLISQFPTEFISSRDFNILDTIKPWVEYSKPIKRRSNQEGYGLFSLQPPPVQDKIIVLCVDFPDKGPIWGTNNINDRFFGDGKSLKKYYTENSYGKHIPTGEVHGWYTAPQPYSYYTNGQSGLGSYPNNTQKLVQDIINIAINDPAINWSSFDTDGDHIIDNLFIVHTGPEGAATGSPDDIWAHVSAITPITRNGYTFQYYATTSEYIYWFFDAQRTGVDSHEFAHLLGLTDLYDFSGNSYGVGNFSLMAHGNWVDNGVTPTHLDAWSKRMLGYTNTLIDQQGTLFVGDAETHDTNYLFTTQYPNEYFMIENRQNINFDTQLPANGILLWKINVNQPTNENELCYKVGLVQADGMKHLENFMNAGDFGDAYPGSTLNLSIDRNTTPSTVLCNGSFPTLSIKDISGSGNTMSFFAELCTQFGTHISIV